MGEGTVFHYQHDARWLDEGVRLGYVTAHQTYNQGMWLIKVEFLTTLQLAGFRRNRGPEV